jgi:hypothetical protein
MTVPSNSAYPLWLQAVHLDFPLFKSTLKYKVNGFSSTNQKFAEWSETLPEGRGLTK